MLSPELVGRLIPGASRVARQAIVLPILAAQNKAGLKLGIQPIGRVDEDERSKYIRHPWLDGQLPLVPTLSDELRILTFIAGNTAAGNISNVTVDWCYLSEETHHKGLEAIMFNLVFSGIPRTLNALSAVKKIGVAQAAVLDPCTPYYSSPDNESGFATAGEAHDARVQKGMDAMKQLYGPKYSRLRSKMRMIHPAVDRFITEFFYGRLHSRGVLTMRESQLVTLAALAGQVVVPQFKSNIIMALRVGATIDEIRGVLDQTHLVWGQFEQAVVDALWSDLNVPLIVKKVKKGEGVSERPEDAEHTPYIWRFDGSDNLEVTKASQQAFNEKAVHLDTELMRPINRHPQFPHFPIRHADNVTDVLRLLAIISGHAAAGNLTRVARDWSYLPPKYHRLGMEAMMQAMVFVGVHTTVNALEVIHDVGVDKSAISYFEEDDDRRRFQTNYEQYYERGCNLLQQIYKNTYDKLRGNLRASSPDIETFVIEFAYGRVLSRPCKGMGAKERELLSLACMSAGEIVFPQLHSHMLGSLNVGATLNDVRAILDLTTYLWGSNNQSMVDGFWLEFRKKYNKNRRSKGDGPTCA